MKQTVSTNLHHYKLAFDLRVKQYFGSSSITVCLMYKYGQCGIQNHRRNHFRWMFRLLFFARFYYMTCFVHVLMLMIEARTIYFILS